MRHEVNIVLHIHYHIHILLQFITFDIDRLSPHPVINFVSRSNISVRLISALSRYANLH